MIINIFTKIVVLLIVLHIIYLYLQITKNVWFNVNHKDIILILKNIVNKINHVKIMMIINIYNIEINNSAYNNAHHTIIKQIMNLFVLKIVQTNHIFIYKKQNV